MTAALTRRLARLEARRCINMARPEPAETDRLRGHIRADIESAEAVFGPADSVNASLMERVARLHELTGGVAFPWWPALRDRRRGRLGMRAAANR